MLRAFTTYRRQRLEAERAAEREKEAAGLQWWGGNMPYHVAVVTVVTQGLFLLFFHFQLAILDACDGFTVIIAIGAPAL